MSTDAMFGAALLSLVGAIAIAQAIAIFAPRGGRTLIEALFVGLVFASCAFSAVWFWRVVPH